MVGTYGTSLKIRVAAPPTQPPNEALRELIAEVFDLKPKDVELMAGGANRQKTSASRASTSKQPSERSSRWSGPTPAAPSGDSRPEVATGREACPGDRSRPGAARRGVR